MSSFEANRLVLRNDLTELDRLAGWIEAWAQPDLSADTSFAIQLCLEEAVANIIMHGRGKDDRWEIAIEVTRNGGTLIARIEDTGRFQSRYWQVRSSRRKSAISAFLSCAALPAAWITNADTAAIG